MELLRPAFERHRSGSTAGNRGELHVENDPIASGTLRVLVVDDIPSARKVVRRLLEKLGIRQVTEACDGATALKMLSEGGVDLVISDWGMPQMDGLELLTKVREQTETVQLPFILITSNADREEVITAYKAGVSDYIVKPFSKDVMAQKLRSVLNGTSVNPLEADEA
jgi:two-component system chemotaxis response regulator CheY